MNRTIFKLIMKSTFISISFFAISLYSPFVYAKTNNTSTNTGISFDASALVTVTQKVSDTANDLLISTSNAVDYLSIGSKIDSLGNTINQTPNAMDRIAPLSVNSNTDIKDTAIETLSYSPSVDLTNSTSNQYIQASINKDRKPSYTYVYSKITSEEAMKFYLLSIVLFTIGTIFITNKWLYNINPSLSFLRNDDLDLSNSVILEQ